MSESLCKLQKSPYIDWKYWIREKKIAHIIYITSVLLQWNKD